MTIWSQFLGPRRILLLVGLSGAFALGLVWFDPATSLLARRLRREVDQVAPDRVAEHLQQLARLGDPGTSALVSSLTSHRRDVIAASSVILHEELRRWQSISPPEATRRVFLLSERLAAEINAMEPLARREAARLGQRILLWPIHEGSVNELVLLEHCETVIRAGAAIPPPPEPTLVAGNDPRTLESFLVGSRSEEDPVGPPPPAETEKKREVAELPGIEVPETQPLPETWPLPETLPPPVAGDAEVPEMPPAAASAPDAAVNEPLSVPSRSAAQLLPQPDRVGVRDDLPAEYPVGLAQPQLSNLPAVEVMRALHTSSAAAAEEELRSRGFGSRELQVARGMFDPDPAVRVRLANSLPSLPGISARPWLLWLARDEEPRVRQAAYGILATSGDPNLLEELRRLQQDETNAGVLESTALDALRR